MRAEGVLVGEVGDEHFADVVARGGVEGGGVAQTKDQFHRGCRV